MSGRGASVRSMSQDGVPPGSEADQPLPVAAVRVVTGLPHLDREFEYAVPPQLSVAAQPGVRVKVRFAGREADGFVVERRAEPSFPGALSELTKVVGTDRVLTPEILRLAKAVAATYAGTVDDVLRLAIPKRHAAAEKRLTEASARQQSLVAAGAVSSVPVPGEASPVNPWSGYPAGPAWLRRIAAGEAPAAAWLALPGQSPDTDWPAAFAEAAAAALDGGRGVILVLPDGRDVDRVDAALTSRLGSDRHVRLTADQGPQARYTAWLKVLRGQVRCVVGNRAAAFAPVSDLGLVAWWDDGDDLHGEPRAPYPHMREVLRLRARQSRAALLVGGFAMTPQTARRVDSGDYRLVAAELLTVRQAAPTVSVAGEGADVERDGAASFAHLPPAAWRAAKAALQAGPVLVQVPRSGYLPALSCADCRAAVRCAHCRGVMGIGARDGVLVCGWCGRDAPVAGFRCSHCDGDRLRTAVVGSSRTAEELGRAFPGVPVISSSAGEVTARVGAAPALVVATPGAEPLAESGYAAALLLDAWALVDLPSLDAGVEALRRWAGAAALVRPRAPVVLCGVPAGPPLAPVEALVRWDPAWLARRELAERVELGLPPVTRMAEVTGSRAALRRAIELLDAERAPAALELELTPPELELVPLDVGAPAVLVRDAPQVRVGDAPPAPRLVIERLGPVPVGDEDWRLLLRASGAGEGALLTSLGALQAIWGARKEREPLHVRVDPDPRS